MRLSKKATTLCAILIGAAILSVSAYADAVIGSGYNRLKNSTKYTLSKLANDVDNFSVDMILSAKIDGSTFAEETVNAKYDIANQVEESLSSTFEKGEKRENYTYRDRQQDIYKHSNEDTYYVYQRQRNDERKIFTNPFEEEQAADAERIIDALVGNLQDVIQVEESGSKKMYMGNLSDTQVPALVNAVSSYLLKYSIFDEYNAKRLNIPQLDSNIYVRDASGKAVENEDGILETVIGSVTVAGRDPKGAEHIFTFELAISITDINNTVVAAPDLQGKNVSYSQDSSYGLDEKYVGKYKNDIIEIQDNAFVKHGERFIEITSVNNGIISGKYYEIFNDEYTDTKARNFEFTSEKSDSKRGYDTIIKYKDENGEDKTGVIYMSGLSDISITLDIIIEEHSNGGYSFTSDSEVFHGNFVRVFE
jgi:hypothetical protein